MNLNSILSILKENKAIFNQYGVKKIGVFGSYVRNEQKTDSDIDILIEFEKGKKSYQNLLKTTELTENLLNKKIDLVTIESLSPYIGPYIKKEVIYA